MSRTRAAAGGVALMVLTQGWLSLLGLAEAMLVPRYLGASGLGRISFAISLLSIASLFVNFGGAMHIVRTVAAREDLADRVLSAVAFLRTVVGVPVAVAVVALSAWKMRDAAMVGLVLVYALRVYLLWLLEALLAYRRALREFATQTRAESLSATVGLGGKVGLLMAGLGPLGVALGDLLTTVSALGIATFWSRRRVRLQRASRDEVRSTVKESWPYFTYYMAQWVIGANTTNYILAAVAGYASVGVLNGALKVMGLLFIIPAAMVNALLPMLTAAFEKSRDDFSRIAQRIAAPMILVCIPLALILMIRPEDILRLFGWPRSLDPVAPVLRVCAVGLLIRYIGMYYGMLLIASNRVWLQTRAAGVAVPVNIVLTLLLALAFDRWFGAAALGAMVAAEITEVVIGVAYMRYVGDAAIHRATGGTVGRGLLAGIPAAAVLMIPLSGRVAFLALCVGAAGVFAGASLLTGALRRDEVQLIAERLRAKTQP